MEMQSSSVPVFLGQGSFAFHRLNSPPLPAASTHPTKLLPISQPLPWLLPGQQALHTAAPPYLNVPTQVSQVQSHSKFYLSSTKSQISDTHPKFTTCVEAFSKTWQSSFLKKNLASSPPHRVFPPLGAIPHGYPAAEHVKMELPTRDCLNSNAVKPRVKPAKKSSSRALSLPVFLAPGCFPFP